MRAIELDLAVRAEEQDAVAAQMAQQIMQQRKRALIGPVQIVDEHQQPALRRQRRAANARRCRTAACAPRSAKAARWARARPALISISGANLAISVAVAPSAVRSCSGALPARPVAERLDERQIGRGRLVLVAAAAQDRRAGSCACAIRSCASRVLPTPGFAREQHEVPARLLRLVPVLLELLLLAAATDELAAHRAAATGGGSSARRPRRAAAESRTAGRRRRAGR